MNGESWEFIKFAIKLSLRYHLRLWAAPTVGAWRNTQRVVAQMSAEVDEFNARQRQRNANGARSVTSGVGPATSEQSH